MQAPSYCFNLQNSVCLSDDSKSVDEGEREGDEEDESFMDDESLIENVDMEDPEDLKIDEEEEDLDFDFDED